VKRQGEGLEVSGLKAWRVAKNGSEMWGEVFIPEYGNKHVDSINRKERAKRAVGETAMGRVRR
jgi:hypothetical protein